MLHSGKAGRQEYNDVNLTVASVEYNHVIKLKRMV